MTKNDKEFVDAVDRWRNESDTNKQIMEFIDELVESVSDDYCECDTFDDGFDACIYMVNIRIRDIINGENK